MDFILASFELLLVSFRSENADLLLAFLRGFTSELKIKDYGKILQVLKQ